jgi:dolichyl-phosphate beta-glucosyltransferase
MIEPLRRGGIELTSLVIPAYNPGPDIDRTWDQVARFVRHAPEPWEAIFVCDGCTDGTPDRLRALSATAAVPLRVLAYPANRGKGYAVRAGLEAARGRWLVFTDADLAYGPNDVARVASRLRAGAAVAVGSREHPASEVVLPSGLAGYALRRHLQSVAFSWLARVLLALPTRDPQAGLKGMHAAVAHRLLPQLTRDGFAFDCELLTACVRLGIPVEEVPVRVRLADRRTTTGLRAAARTIRDLFAVRRDWRPARAAAVGFPEPVGEPGDLVRAA